MASGDIKHYIEETDITMMYSVVDIAGSQLDTPEDPLQRSRSDLRHDRVLLLPLWTLLQSKMHLAKRVAITMFGVTTPCVDAYPTYPDMLRLMTTLDSRSMYFHATGAGGKAMERSHRRRSD